MSAFSYTGESISLPDALENRGNFPEEIPFRNKKQGQFTLIQSQLSQPAKLDASLFGRFASRASTLSNPVAFKLNDACENGHDHFSLRSR